MSDHEYEVEHYKRNRPEIPRGGGGKKQQQHNKVMSFVQTVALVMVNKLVKFDENSLIFVKVMAEIC